MSSLSVEEKLLLIQKMRNHSEENNLKIQKRDQIYRNTASEKEDDALSGEPTEGFRFLKLRIYACLLLFGAFVLVDRSGISMQGHRIREVIPFLQDTVNMGKADEALQAWSENFVKTILKNNEE